MDIVSSSLEGLLQENGVSGSEREESEKNIKNIISAFQLGNRNG